MLVTFVVTLVLGVQQGLLAGVVLSIARVIYTSGNAPHDRAWIYSGGRLFRNVNRFDDVVIRDDILIFRFDAPLYFANKGLFCRQSLSLDKATPR